MKEKYVSLLLWLAWCLSAFSCVETVVPERTVDSLPPLFPDYTEVTVPATIAPLNFRAATDCQRIDVSVKVGNEEKIHLQSDRVIAFPLKTWRKLLEEVKGGSLELTVSLRRQGKWVRYAPFRIYVSEAPADPYLVYRLVAPGYEIYSKMGIYQRSLSDFTQKPLFENTLIPSSCVNCHAFCAQSPERMSLHLRGDHGGTVLLSEGRMELLDTKAPQMLSSAVYPYWHPSGKYIAYSVNQTQQVFHAAKDERVEVLDLASDLVVYDVEKNTMFTSPLLQSSAMYETFPSFSPDGKSLYYCSARQQKLPGDYRKIRYNLCRLDFDPATAVFGTRADTLVQADSLGKSVSFPRPSPDGNYLMYTLSDYGNFSIWHREADLWLLDLRTGEKRCLDEANSPDVESYHSWSSNGRWFVFSSRRIDGLYTRLFLAYIGPDGKVGKPFLLPQEDPDSNEGLLYSYNIPEWVSGPVSLDAEEIEQKALDTRRKKAGFR